MKEQKEVKRRDYEEEEITKIEKDDLIVEEFEEEEKDPRKKVEVIDE